MHYFNVFDWRSVDKIIDIGYRYTLEKLAESDRFCRTAKSPSVKPE